VAEAGDAAAAAARGLLPREEEAQEEELAEAGQGAAAGGGAGGCLLVAVVVVARCSRRGCCFWERAADAQGRVAARPPVAKRCIVFVAVVVERGARKRGRGRGLGNEIFVRAREDGDVARVASGTERAREARLS
jgi:GNAT superfamily N-acetyltransferase